MIQKKKVGVILGDPQRTDSVKPNGRFSEADLKDIKKLEDALATLGDYSFRYFNNHNSLPQELTIAFKRRGILYALNLCDEGFENDPRREKDIPQILEDLHIPYTGAGASCMTLCYDKAHVLEEARKLCINTPSTEIIEGSDHVQLSKITTFPVIVKPNYGDGGQGITAASVADTQEKLTNAFDRLRTAYNGKILVQEFLDGDDLTLGIIGNADDFTILPITREDFTRLNNYPELPRICGYEAKWYQDSPYWNIKTLKAELDPDTREVIVSLSRLLFTELECKDYARIDWRLNSKGKPYLLEVNPNPGWVHDGHLAKAAAFADISYPSMLEKILHAAEKRIDAQRILKRQ